MKNVTRSLVLVAALTLLALVPGGFADTFTLISGGPGNAYGESTGPYSASINGVTTPVWCDDIRDTMPTGLQFTYNAVAGNAIIYGANTNVMWGADTTGKYTAQQNYGAAAWLMIQAVANPSQASLYNFAIWDAFNDAAVTAKIGLGNNPFTLLQVQALVTTAVNSYSAADLAHVTFFLDSQCAGLGIDQGQNCTPTSYGAQEFGVVPEGGTALAYSLMAGIACFGAMFYSRRQNAMNGLV